MGTTNVDQLAIGAAGAGKVMYEVHGSLARTDTTDKTLFTLPANAVPLGFSVYSPAVSNAGTSATLSVGKAGTDTFFLNAFDVKGSTGTGHQAPTAQSNLFASVGASALPVVGIYAETGTASSAGGPWVVTCRYEV